MNYSKRSPSFIQFQVGTPTKKKACIIYLRHYLQHNKNVPLRLHQRSQFSSRYPSYNMVCHTKIECHASMFCSRTISKWQILVCASMHTHTICSCMLFAKLINTDIRSSPGATASFDAAIIGLSNSKHGMSNVSPCIWGCAWGVRHRPCLT